MPAVQQALPGFLLPLPDLRRHQPGQQVQTVQQALQAWQGLPVQPEPLALAELLAWLEPPGLPWQLHCLRLRLTQPQMALEEEEAFPPIQPLRLCSATPVQQRPPHQQPPLQAAFY